MLFKAMDKTPNTNKGEGRCHEINILLNKNRYIKYILETGYHLSYLSPFSQVVETTTFHRGVAENAEKNLCVLCLHCTADARMVSVFKCSIYVYDFYLETA